jgi:predicted branched-subunit amino acid permease
MPVIPVRRDHQTESADQPTEEPTMTNDNHHEFAAGARAMTPWLIGIAPFGLVIGISAARSSMPVGAGWLTGVTIYGGSAQVAAIQMIGAGAAPVAVIMTVLIINLRLVIYSAAVAPYWRGMPLWWRLLGGYLLVDPSFAVGLPKYASEPDRGRAHRFYLGGAVVLWLSWIAAITVGITVGAQVPGWLHLELIIPLFLIGEVVPKMRERGARWAVLAAILVALVSLAAPLHLGIVAAIVAGMAAGTYANHHPVRTGPPTPASAPAVSTEEVRA